MSTAVETLTDTFDFVDAAYEFAARLCAHMVTDGYSVLLLGLSGAGKSLVAGMARTWCPNTSLATSRSGTSAPSTARRRPTRWPTC
jgi:ABC-type glutathione transport system ATPase component